MGTVRKYYWELSENTIGNRPKVLLGTVQGTIGNCPRYYLELSKYYWELSKYYWELSMYYWELSKVLLGTVRKYY